MREVAGEIMRVAKALRIAVLLVGHVTKDGALAGPRVLEHLVDCVLQFEGERERTYRTVRAIKNRFGSTNEAGVFEMRDDGLVEVLDASARFVGRGDPGARAASCCARWRARGRCWSRSRRSSPPPSWCRRAGWSAGLDRNRVALVLAVLGRHAGIGLGAADVFVNVVGGVRVEEPGADLAVALAVASAAKRVRADRRRRRRPLACFGELGLTGELRTVAHADRRLAEADEVRAGAGGRARGPSGRFSAALVRALDGAAERARSRRDGSVARQRLELEPAHPVRIRSRGRAVIPQDRVKSALMPPRSGEELKEELESRQESRMVRALEMVAPGTALREGIDNILHARTGGLIVIGDADELAFLFSGGIKLELDYSPALLYELAKMDGAIVLNANATKIVHANVQLTPDPTILTLETGTRHRTAERVSKQTDALVVAISERREVVSLYVDGIKYILEDIPVVLAKANQALATLDKYRSRLDQVSTRLTALEFEGGATLHDVLTVLQRAELVTRMAVEIERYIVELGTEGRLIEMQLDETMVGVSADKAALVHDYLIEDDRRELRRPRSTSSCACPIKIFSTSVGWPSCSATTAS